MEKIVEPLLVFSGQFVSFNSRNLPEVDLPASIQFNSRHSEKLPTPTICPQLNSLVAKELTTDHDVVACAASPQRQTPDARHEANGRQGVAEIGEPGDSIADGAPLLEKYSYQ